MSKHMSCIPTQKLDQGMKRDRMPPKTETFWAISHSCIPTWLLFTFIRWLPARLCAHFAAQPIDRISANHQSSTATNSRPPSYIEDGYNIILTDAPNDLGGRLRRNCARTTPELPGKLCQLVKDNFSSRWDIPCGLVTFPQMTLILDPLTSFDAR